MAFFPFGLICCLSHLASSKKSPRCSTRTTAVPVRDSATVSYTCDTCKPIIPPAAFRYTCRNVTCPHRTTHDSGFDMCPGCASRDPEKPLQPAPGPPPRAPQYAPFSPGPTRTHQCLRELSTEVQPLWVIALTQVARKVLRAREEGDLALCDRALVMLIDLPGNRLCTGPSWRGGRARTFKRMRARLLKDPDDFWEVVPPLERRAVDKFARTVQLARAGLFSKAATALLLSTESGLWQGSPEEAQRIITELHPAETDVQPVRLPPVVSAPHCLEAIRRISARGVAPGPSGWTYELLAPFLAADRDLAMAVLQVLAERLLAPDCSPILRERLTASRLLLIKKHNASSGDKPRPVAVGEFFLRFAAHACMPPQLQETFEPLQLGVGTKGGVESVVHWARHEHGIGKVLVTLDMSNAFNTANRKAMASALQEILVTQPDWDRACALFNATYVAPSLLLSQWFDHYSQRGSRQGCVFGGLLFSVVLQPILRRLATKYPSLGVKAYLDDINVSVPDADLVSSGGRTLFAAFFSELGTELQQVGLVLNPRKCAYRHPAGQVVGALDGLAFANSPTAIRVLGAFVGTHAGITTQLDRIVLGHEQFFRLLADPELHTGVGYDILRFSGLPRVNHLARTHAPEQTEAAMVNFDSMVLKTFVALADLQEPLDRSTTAQISLPIALGGFGLTRFSEIRQAAFEASLGQFGVSSGAWITQNESARALHIAKHEQLLATATQHTRARLLSCAGKGGWLNWSSHIGPSMNSSIGAAPPTRDCPPSG